MGGERSEGGGVMGGRGGWGGRDWEDQQADLEDQQGDLEDQQEDLED